MTATVSASRRPPCADELAPGLMSDLLYVVHFPDGKVLRCDYWLEAKEAVQRGCSPKKKRRLYGDDALRSARNAEIYAMHRRGVRVAEIVGRFGVTESTVMRVCAALRKQGL